MRSEALVEGRYECFGEVAWPDFFSEQQCWEHYREAVAQDAYWLSCEETALVALLAGRSVDIYKFNMMLSTFELEASIRSPIVDMEVVSIALEPGEEDRGGVRGHFSRIWPETTWDEHAVIVAAATARQQRELEEMRLRDRDAQGERDRLSLGRRDDGQERGSPSRASSCPSFSSEVQSGP